MDRSTWWNSREIGAFRYEGEFEGKKAVLKIQGVKPITSEIYMIKSFAKANKSKILRPSLLYGYLDWDEKMRYEALVLEFVEGKRIVQNPTNEGEIDEFFKLREEYRGNCVADPWIEKPGSSLSEEAKLNFEKWRQASFRLFPTHPSRKPEDKNLIDSAVKILVKNYGGVVAEFQHGHFSTTDLLKTKKGEVIVLSNLYWSWKPPFYDAVFGYHWYIYNLANLNSVTPALIEQQRNLWMSKINRLAKTEKDRVLLNLALLERATAGLNLDVLSIDPKNPVAEYLICRTRENIQTFLAKF